MESQTLEKGNAISFGLKFYCNCSKGVGFSPSAVTGSWASLWNSVSAVLEHRCLPPWVSNILRETHYEVYWKLFFPGVVMHLQWRFLSLLQHFCCARQNISVISGVRGPSSLQKQVCPGGLTLPPPIAPSITPKGRQKWEETQRAHPWDQDTQATSRDVVI